ncbi:MAG: replication initiator protein A [Roseovarius sp.]|nr:replication initiator protein A [Roseovarius sp.]MBQ0809505.1 replication initiator protein A [Roseovarius sp.]
MDGLAIVHARDILAYCISQLMTAINEDKEVLQTIRFRTFDMLVATKRNTAGSG